MNMASCDVICDLMEIYQSGEASQATQEIVEKHLEECANCREAYSQYKEVEKALDTLEPVDGPSDGQYFISRTKRVAFGVVAGLLFVITFGMAFISRMVFEEWLGMSISTQDLLFPGPFWWVGGIAALGVYIFARGQLERHSGEEMRWRKVYTSLKVIALLVAGLAAFGIIVTWEIAGAFVVGYLIVGSYIYMLRQRSQRKGASDRDAFLLSLEAAAPLMLLGLILAFVSIVDVAILSAFLLAALALTLPRLPKIRYMGLVTILVLFTSIFIISVQSTILFTQAF
jgi:hypothetical protein